MTLLTLRTDLFGIDPKDIILRLSFRLIALKDVTLSDHLSWVSRYQYYYHLESEYTAALVGEG